MMPYERFEAWKVCDELALAVHVAARTFPKEELYGVTSQARRAAFSAAVNIAEGSAKPGAREFGRFLNISIGSLAELAYTLRYGRRIALLSEEDYQKLERLRARAGFLTWKLYDAMRKKR